MTTTQTITIEQAITDLDAEDILAAAEELEQDGHCYGTDGERYEISGMSAAEAAAYCRSEAARITAERV